MKKLFLMIPILLGLHMLQGQNMRVKGIITQASDGTPLPGVVIMERGTTNGAISDAEGSYTVNLSGKASTLEYKMVGMKTVIKEITESGTMDVSMEEDALLLDEVVVTALGISQAKKSLGYSVQTVSGDALSNSGEVNVINGLSAKVAGVQVVNSSGAPGASAYIRIRGSSSLTGNNQPLMVVDGVPLDNSQISSGNPDDGDNNLLFGVANSNRAVDINPDDIEDVTVLKGPSAAALYGIQAANGAILITTKKGTASAGKGINVSYSTGISIDQVNRYQPLQTQFAKGNAFDGGLNPYNADSSPVYFGPHQSSSQSWGPNIDSLYWDHDPTYRWDSHGRIVGASDSGAIEKVKAYDNQRDLFQTGTTYDQTLSLSGGNQNTTFRASFGNLKQHGIIPLSTFNRTTAKLSGETRLSSKIKVASSVTYVNSGGSRVQQGSNTSGLMLGLLRTPITFDNSNGATDPSDPSAYIFADGSQRNYRNGVGYDNPYWTMNQNPYKDNVNRFYGFSSITYDVTKWLNVFYRAGTDFYSDQRDQSFAINSRTYPAGHVFNDRHNYRHVNSDLWVTLNHAFGANLKGSLILGNNIYNENYQRLYAQGDGFNFPGFTQISNAQSVLVRESRYAIRRTSGFFDAKVDFKNYLFVEVTGRNEWSSTLPTSKNSFFYPSANMGFVFTDALKMADNKILPYGKIRASYSKVGKDAGPYSIKNYFNSTTFADGWTNGVSFPVGGYSGFQKGDVLGNANLKPEKTTAVEFGVDLKFLKNRLGLDFTVYQNTSKDQIFSVAVPPSTGYQYQIVNAGKITNTGIEIMLTGTPVKKKDLRWDVGVNFSRNRNMVVELAPGIENIFIGGFEGSAIRAVAGQPYGMIYGGKWLRDDNDNVVIESDTNSQFYGYPVADPTEKPIGNPNPKFLMNMRNTVTWKSLSLSVLLDYRHGGDIWNGTRGILNTFGMSEETEDRGQTKVFEGVMGTLDGDGNLISSGVVNTNEVVLGENWYKTQGGGFGTVSEQFIEDGSYLKLREVSLFYTLKPDLLTKVYIRGVSLGFTARNFILWTKFRGIDPETNLMGASNAQGLEYFNMPNTQSYIFTVKVNL